VKATLQIICNLGDIRNIHVLSSFVVVFAELEIHLLGKEEFQEEVHNLRVLLLLEVVVSEHSNASTDHQLSS
jgi:hypothetical protein